MTTISLPMSTTALSAINRHKRTEYLASQIMELLTDEPQRCMAIAQQLRDEDGYEITCQKTSAVLKQMYHAGLVDRVLISEENLTIKDKIRRGETIEPLCDSTGSYIVHPNWEEVSYDVHTKVYGFVKIGA